MDWREPQPLTFLHTWTRGTRLGTKDALRSPPLPGGARVQAPRGLRMWKRGRFPETRYHKNRCASLISDVGVINADDDSFGLTVAPLVDKRVNFTFRSLAFGGKITPAELRQEG